MNNIEQKDIELQDKIDNYLLEKMNLQERSDFEKLLVADNELKQKVETQKLIVEEIINRAAFNKIVNKVREKDKWRKKFRETMTVTFSAVATYKMTIAWSAAAIFIGVFFVNNIVQNSRMDNLYTVNYSMPQANDTRGDNPIEQAAKLLGNDQPKQAKIILESIYNNNSISVDIEEVRWYLALTELKLHNKTNAKKYLNELKGSNNYGKKADEILKKLK